MERTRQYFVKEFEIELSGSETPTSILFFVNELHEPIYFPDRCLASLFNVNLSTLRGRFNRLVKKNETPYRMLISEKSKTKLSEYHYINWENKVGLMNKNRLQITGSAEGNSTFHDSYTIPKQIIQHSQQHHHQFDSDEYEEYSGQNSTPSSPLHGLVALNHITLVNLALSEWIATNYERLGTNISLIVENFKKCEIPFIKSGDKLEIVINAYQDLLPALSCNGNGAAYIARTNSSPNMLSGYQVSKFYKFPIEEDEPTHYQSAPASPIELSGSNSSSASRTPIKNQPLPPSYFYNQKRVDHSYFHPYKNSSPMVSNIPTNNCYSDPDYNYYSNITINNNIKYNQNLLEYNNLNTMVVPQKQLSPNFSSIQNNNISTSQQSTPKSSKPTLYHYHSQPILPTYKPSYQNKMKLEIDTFPTQSYPNWISCSFEDGTSPKLIDISNFNEYHSFKEYLSKAFNLMSFMIIGITKPSKRTSLQNSDEFIQFSSKDSVINEKWFEFCNTVKKIIIKPINITPDIQNLLN